MEVGSSISKPKSIAQHDYRATKNRSAIISILSIPRRFRSSLGRFVSTVGFVTSSLSALQQQQQQQQQRMAQRKSNDCKHSKNAGRSVPSRAARNSDYQPSTPWLPKPLSMIWEQTFGGESWIAFWNFLQSSKIDQEIQDILHAHQSSKTALFLSFGILQRIHQYHHTSDHRSLAYLNTQQNVEVPLSPSSLARYMRFATAAYGSPIIYAAQMETGGKPGEDVRANFDNGSSTTSANTKMLHSLRQTPESQSISHHVGVPVEDLKIVSIDEDYYPINDDDDADITDGTRNDREISLNQNHMLHHLIAIDHQHRQIILSIRGTYSIQDVFVDLTSFAREDFRQGQAHEGMASMAERVWKIAGPTIVRHLEHYPNYELILTGHSLGAGTVCLLTLLLDTEEEDFEGVEDSSSHDKKYMVDQIAQPRLPVGTRLRCVAFATPPVFGVVQSDDSSVSQTSKNAQIISKNAMTSLSKTMDRITQVIHADDIVPSLSIHSARQLLVALERTYQSTKELSTMERLSLAMGWQTPSNDLVESLQVRNLDTVMTKPGAPILQVPAGHTIHLSQQQGPMKSQKNEDTYDTENSYFWGWYHSNDWLGVKAPQPIPPFITLHSNMFIDHLPSQYEYALDRCSTIVTRIEEQP